MPIDSDAYQELEAVVGPENISQDPAILDTYSCHATIVGIPRQGLGLGPWWERAGAVILPGSTEEVSEIVKICNYYRIKYKAHSTGQFPGAFAQGENTLTIDLRRMNRIIEINQDHMYALVEPYVTQGELFIECIKKGLAPHMIDAGSSISPLASVTSVAGQGDSAITRGYNERNALAVEWVLPSGEIVRLGSPDTPNAGWFSGDGPGPSLLGIMRGGLGALGERGVFTKVAIKLYPWYGPKKLAKGGKAPWFEIDTGPLIKEYFIKWKDYKDEADGLYLIGEAEIFDSFGKISCTKLEAIIANSKSEWARIRRWGKFQEFIPHGLWSGAIVAKTKEHLEYCEEALFAIAQKTNGEVLTYKDFPVPEGVDEPENFHFRLKQALLQLGFLKDYTSKACIMPMMGTVGPQPAMSYYSIDQTLKCHKEIAWPIKEKAQKKGYVLDDGPDGCWCILEEGGHHMHYMNFTRVEPKDPKANPRQMAGKSAIKVFLKGYHIIGFMPGLDKMAPPIRYIRKLSKRLDPQQVSSPGLQSGNISALKETLDTFQVIKIPDSILKRIFSYLERRIEKPKKS